MIGLLHVGSLVLGVIAWVLPVINLLRNPKAIGHQWVVFSIISLSACAISLFFQMMDSYIRVKEQDWSALMDIMGSRVSIAAVLLVTTIILNGITLIVYRNKGKM